MDYKKVVTTWVITIIVTTQVVKKLGLLYAIYSNFSGIEPLKFGKIGFLGGTAAQKLFFQQFLEAQCRQKLNISRKVILK